MSIARLLHTCFRNILRNRMRSLLTSLGIIIGVGSVIIMVAVGEGAQKTIESRIAAMGTNLIQVMPRRVFVRNAQPGGVLPRPNRITRSDAEKVKTEAGYALAVSGVTQRSFTVSANGVSRSTTVMGVEPDYLIVRSWGVSDGVFFDESDGLARNRVAALGATAAEQHFGGESPLGKEIRIGANNFTVTAVLEKKGAGGSGNDQDDVIMVPLDTALTRLMNSKNISSLAVSAVSKRYMAAAQKEVELILREAHKLKDDDAADFEIMNSSDLIEMASETSRSLTTLLAAIAGVSLLVGGIGIMNIMLVSVTERTREIGIRMSVGAKKRDILFQFLSESVILSLMGGLIGTGLAALVCRILAAAGVPSSINPLVVAIAAAFAALVGVFFGFYPADKAAALYPIDALRYE
ncbi:MAG: multidrug ABC transporter substrate-binding protein [Treponematales bacterium]